MIDGFQAKKDTYAIFIDLQQAYDRIWRKGLLMKMQKLGINGKMIGWIQAFLTNRTIQTRFDGALSSKLTLEEGGRGQFGTVPLGYRAIMVPCHAIKVPCHSGNVPLKSTVPLGYLRGREIFFKIFF